MKEDGDPDLSKDDAMELFKEWKDQGKPGPDTKRRLTGAAAPFISSSDKWCLQVPDQCKELLKDLGENIPDDDSPCE